MTILNDIEEYDDIRKAVMRLMETVNHAFIAAEPLDDKVKMDRLRKEIYQIDRILKLQYYEVQDAINWAKKTTRCESCHSIHPAREI